MIGRGAGIVSGAGLRIAAEACPADRQRRASIFDRPRNGADDRPAAPWVEAKVEDLGAGDRVGASHAPACDEDLPAGQHGRGVRLANVRERRPRRPGPRRRIVDLGGVDLADARSSTPTGDQHLAIRKQRGGVVLAASRQGPGEGPRAGVRIVQLCARERLEGDAPHDQDAAVGEGGCRVLAPAHGERTRWAPRTRAGVVDLRAGQLSETVASGDEHLAAREQRRGLAAASGAHRQGRRPRPGAARCRAVSRSSSRGRRWRWDRRSRRS